MTHAPGSSRFNIIGALCAFYAAFSYGVMPLLANFFYQEGGNTTTFIFLRTSISFLVFMPLFALWQGASFRITKQQFKNVALLALIIGAIYFTYFTAVVYISVSLLLILFFTYPFFTLGFEWLLGAEHITKGKVYSLIIAFTGLILVVGPHVENVSVLGVVLALSAGIFMALDFVVTKRVTQSMSSFIFLFYVGVILFLPLLLINAHTGWQPGSWPLMAAAIFFTVTGDLCYIRAIRTIGTIKSAHVMNLEPAIGIMLSAWLLNESMAAVQYAGGGIVILSLYLLHRSEQRKAPRP